MVNLLSLDSSYVLLDSFNLVCLSFLPNSCSNSRYGDSLWWSLCMYGVSVHLCLSFVLRRNLESYAIDSHPTTPKNDDCVLPLAHKKTPDKKIHVFLTMKMKRNGERIYAAVFFTDNILIYHFPPRQWWSASFPTLSLIVPISLLLVLNLQMQ